MLASILTFFLLCLWFFLGVFLGLGSGTFFLAWSLLLVWHGWRLRYMVSGRVRRFGLVCFWDCEAMGWLKERDLLMLGLG